jgi:hypothetical protein
MSVQADDFPFGPLDQRAHGLFQVGTSGFTPDAPTRLKKDDLQVHLSLSSINVMNDATPTYTADMEFERLSVNMWYGISDRFSIGIAVPFETVNGGFQDSLISSFHKAFGLNNGTRDQFARNRVNINVHGQSVTARPAFGLSDIFTVGNYQIFQDGDLPGWSIGYQIKFPTASSDDIYSSRGYGFGIATNVFHQMGDWYFNAGGSVARLGSEEIIGQKLKPTVQTLFFMVEYRALDWLSIVAQGIAQSGVAYDLGEYSRWSFEVDGGFKVVLSKNMMWDLGFFENVVKYSNSADFGLFTGFTVRY